MRPASITVTTRFTRSRAISGCHVTSTKWQPNEWVENFGFGIPKVASAFPWPGTRRMFARFNTSAKGTPLPGPSAVTKTFPLPNDRSLDVRFSKGDPGVFVATVSSDATALSAAANTAGTIEPVTIEPPEIGPSGSDVSPNMTSTLSSGTPVLSETSCARIVYVPVPMSCVPDATRALPSSRSWTLASAGNRAATHAAPAKPHPRINPSRFIEPTSGVRLAQPNFSAPSSRHST